MTTEQNPTPRPLPEAERGLPAPPSRFGKGAGGLGLRLVFLLGLVAVVGFAVWFFPFHTPTTDLELLQGDWQASTGDRETANVFQVTGDQWQAIANGVKARPYRITLNPAANPKEIDLDLIDTANIHGPLPKLHGIYAFDGEKVRVRLVPGTEPRPTSFDDTDAIVLTLTKVKLEPAKQPRK